MKHLTANRICAGMLSLALAAGNLTPAFTVQAADKVNLPDWIPSNYEEALEFRNNFGHVYIWEGLLCVQYDLNRPLEFDTNGPRYEVLATKGVMEEVASFTFEEETVLTEEEPKYGGQSDRIFKTVVYKPVAAGKFETALADRMLKGGGESVFDDGMTHTIAHYDFIVNEELEITETDIFSWLPDCNTEYERYVSDYGKASAHGEYMVICLSEAAGTPYTWKEKETNPEWESVSDCSYVYAQPVGGGRMAYIYLYRAKEDGPVDIVWEFVQSFGDAEPTETIEGNYIALDGGKTILSPNRTCIRLINADTLKLIDLAELGEYPCITTDVAYYNEQFKEQGGDGWIYTGPVYLIEGNPMILGQTFTSFFSADRFSFSFSSGSPCAREISEKRKITKYDNGSYEVDMYIQTDIMGDLNRDNEFSIADLVCLQRWLLGDQYVLDPPVPAEIDDPIVIDDPVAVSKTAADNPYSYDLMRWRCGDFNNDYRLDARDLTLMKQALMKL
ncbi:MAG: hypothetical protein IKI58_10485 [Oscillospiraceae bacterium]|nr:hypothetical protein [Oscillospiraceae bacterium]